MKIDKNKWIIYIYIFQNVIILSIYLFDWYKKYIIINKNNYYKGINKNK